MFAIQRVPEARRRFALLEQGREITPHPAVGRFTSPYPGN
jgi:hypothetical protein